MANYDSQLVDYGNYTVLSAPVNLTAVKNTFGYAELSAVIIIRAATDFLDPATQYNLDTVWTPGLATKIESGTTGETAMPTERWS